MDDSSTPSEGVTLEVSEGGIAFITLRRERVLNALNGAMMRGLWAALDGFHHDPSARVAIIRADGRAFCVGADIHQLPTAGRVDPAEDLNRISEAFLNRDRFKPIIASVHGHVVGAGVRIALLCDFVVCAESTCFRIPEVGHGLNAGFYWTLIQTRAGDAFAMDAVASGRTWSAHEATERGLALRCVSDDLLEEATLEYAVSIASQPAGAMEALVGTRRAALRMLDVQAWTSRTPSLGWSSIATGGPEGGAHRRERH